MRTLLPSAEGRIAAHARPDFRDYPLCRAALRDSRLRALFTNTYEVRCMRARNCKPLRKLVIAHHATNSQVAQIHICDLFNVVQAVASLRCHGTIWPGSLADKGDQA